MISKNLLFIFLIPFLACSDEPYDTSSPEKFVESMGLISQQDASDNPLPYFYDEESAEAIGTFDALGEKVQIAFDAFRNNIATKFPNHTKKNEEGLLKIALDGYAAMKIRNFTFSASLIGAQLKQRDASDYEFISATDPDDNGITQLTVKITGNEKTLPLKKIEDCYKMFLTPDVLENIYQSIGTLEELDALFSNANEMLENGEITEENFEEKFEEIATNYEQVLN